MSVNPVQRQHLIFDADDTLWENNIYFEEAFDQFCEYLSHSTLKPPEIRMVLNEIELANAKVHGYGSKNFGRNLDHCFKKLVERDVSAQDAAEVMRFAEAIMEKPIELLPGVRETLAELATRHELLLFTKGHPAEQQAKVDRSGLGEYFSHVAIVKEKNSAAYIELARHREFADGCSWMIGNSPKSDVNPALAAGMNAVFIPHPRTWCLELESLPDAHPRLLRLSSISDLTHHF